jgi:hypothetical protein
MTFDAGNEHTKGHEPKHEGREGDESDVEVELDDEGDEGNESPEEPGHPVWRGVASVGVSDIGDEANDTDASTDVDKPRGQHVS